MQSTNDVYGLTGYSVVRSLSEAPKYASVLASILKKDSDFRHNLALQNTPIPSMLGTTTTFQSSIL